MQNGELLPTSKEKGECFLIVIAAFYLFIIIFRNIIAVLNSSALPHIGNIEHFGQIASSQHNGTSGEKYSLC